MNDPNDFLTRWSRRKREAATESARPPRDEQRASDAPAEQRAADDATPPVVDSGTAKPVFDLSKLPTIESITAQTDLRVFLAPGVPAELRLAALRRAWVADPKVRDFVGLADYDFDFHTPGAIPGFGPLEMTDELRQEVVRIISGWQPEGEAGATGQPDRTIQPESPPAQPTAAIADINAQPAPIGPASANDPDAGLGQPARDQDKVITSQVISQRSKDTAAMQQEQLPAENLQTLARRGHGRALPE